MRKIISDEIMYNVYLMNTYSDSCVTLFVTDGDDGCEKPVVICRGDIKQKSIYHYETLDAYVYGNQRFIDDSIMKALTILRDENE